MAPPGHSQQTHFLHYAHPRYQEACEWAIQGSNLGPPPYQGCGVEWVWAQMAAELARVRYIEYSYWNELWGGSRLAADAAQRINAGRAAVRCFERPSSAGRPRVAVR